MVDYDALFDVETHIMEAFGAQQCTIAPPLL